MRGILLVLLLLITAPLAIAQIGGQEQLIDDRSGGTGGGASLPPVQPPDDTSDDINDPTVTSATYDRTTCAAITDEGAESTILAHSGAMHVCGDHQLPTHITYQAYGTGGVDCEKADGQLAGNASSGALSIITIQTIPGEDIAYQARTTSGWGAPKNAGEPAGNPVEYLYQLNLTRAPSFTIQARIHTAQGPGDWQEWREGRIIGSATTPITGIQLRAASSARPDYVDFHGENMCDRLTTFEGSGRDITYTCAVRDGTWQWERGSPAYQPGDADRTRFSIPQSLTNTPVTCYNGAVVAASTKYSPPPELDQSACALQQCWDGERCVEQGEREGSYVCEDVAGEGQWVSAVSRLADELLDLQDGDFLLNCGPQQTTINQEEAPSEWGYCTLLLLDGDDVQEIVLGVALNNERGETLDYSFFEGQVKANHPTFNVSRPRDFPYVHFNESSATARFTTSAEGFGTGTTQSLWGRILGVFGLHTGSDDPITLRSKTAEQLFISSSDGQYVVEWSDGECGRVILGPGEYRACYSETLWREIIHQR